MAAKTKKYTLITGASSGLGKELAVQCAKKGMNVLLLALPGSPIFSIADQLSFEYNIDAKAFELNITDIALLQKELEKITSLYPIDFLINNAGIGGTSAITTTSIEEIDEIILLNVRSTALLTRLLLPHLLKSGRSYILNIASMAAFTPIAYKTVYPASKAFIASFSLGLKEELADSGLSVSVAYPGPMMTNSHTSRRILSQGIRARMSLLPASRIAAIAIDKALSGHSIIIPGIANQISRFLLQLLPTSVKLKMVSKEIKKELSFSSYGLS